MTRSKSVVQLLLVLAVLVCVGCQYLAQTSRKPDSEFQWRNENPDTVWIDSASGFAIDPNCGVLSGTTGSSGAQLTLPHQAFPPNTSITWWYGDRKDKDKAEIRKTLVTIPPLPSEEGRHVLVFTLRKSLDWDAHWEASRY